MTAGEKRILDIHKLEELRQSAYENAKIYKERTKAWHDKRIVKKDLNIGDHVLLFNSRLRLFPGKLRLRWTDPFKVSKILRSGAVEIKNETCSPFIVNGQRLKLYEGGDIPTDYSIHTLIDPPIPTTGLNICNVCVFRIPFPNFYRMQDFDDMHVAFRDDAQRDRYIALHQLPMAPTRYPDQHCMEALGIEPSIRSLSHQLHWDEFTNDLSNTYRNLTLKFLSSFDYDPYSGPDGYAAFRLFGIEYSFRQNEFGDLLGFQTTPDAIPETPMGYFLGKEVEKFWSDISGGGSQDPSTQLSQAIHNPVLWYFQMILAHSFLGRPDTETLLSEEEIFLLFCASQSRHVACGNFLLCGLSNVTRSSEGVIHVGGIITQIVIALGLSRKLLHLTTFCGYTILDIDFCLTRGLIRRSPFNPRQFRLLIDSEAIHYFTLPDPMMTSVHDPANWSYALEGQGETIEEPRSPPVAEYTPTLPSPRITVLSNNLSLQTPDIRTQIADCRREITRLRQEVADLTLQMAVSDLTHATEADYLYQEIAELGQKIARLRGSSQADEPPII
ncbi:hypothetical protein KIW84_042185 [Lathyrus oleraceus]|uniref:Arabidopsis retrotransposon Orf1 C-terminal domain-containing protein n=1 Tax=Pisum sativum TaxID=3888 RepID=A0A9D4XAE2_PEA|nr:hypothetical protein KIW84_042185 [Pisum sativum]